MQAKEPVAEEKADEEEKQEEEESEGGPTAFVLTGYLFQSAQVHRQHFRCLRSGPYLFGHRSRFKIPGPYTFKQP